MQTVNKSKKVDPYTASFNTDETIRNFMNGVYFNTRTHRKELLNRSTTKYNISIIAELNELNGQFRSLIIVYDITLKLITEHKDFRYGDSKNIYRLLHAQSGTIRFNRALKIALKKYAVNKQKVYDKLKEDIRKQVDRIARNKQLILDMFVDYGMNNLTDLVKEDTNMDIFEHAEKFSNKLQESVVIVTDEDEKEFYNLATNKYIEYLKDLAVRYNINIFEDISQTLANSRKLKEAKSLAIKQESKILKEKSRTNRLIQKLMQDGANIQSDLDDATYIIESNKYGKKLGCRTIRDLREKLSKYNNIVYYIAGTVDGAVKYVTDDNKLSTSLNKTLFFNSIDEANKRIQNIKQTDLGIQLTMTVIKLINNKGDLEKVINSSYINNATKIISSLIEIGDEEDNLALTVNVINSAYGADYKNNSGDAIVYVCEQHANKVICKNESNNKLFIGSVHENPVIVSKSNARSSVNLGEYSFKPESFNFDSSWYASVLNNIQNENSFIQALLNNPSMDVYRIYNIRYESEMRKYTDNLKRVKNKIINLEQLNQLRSNKVYYVAIHKVTKFVSFRHIQYAKKRNSNSITGSTNEMDIYTDYNEALSICNSLINSDKNRVYIVCKIDCTYIKQTFC